MILKQLLRNPRLIWAAPKMYELLNEVFECVNEPTKLDIDALLSWIEHTPFPGQQEGDKPWRR